MSEVVPTRDQIAGALADLDIDSTLLSPEARVLISTATIDTTFLRGAFRLALSALDAKKAAGEGVTDQLVSRITAELQHRENPPLRWVVRESLERGHPAIFAAGENAGLEKAADRNDQIAAGLERIAAQWSDGPSKMSLLGSALSHRAEATAIRSLKGGTP